MSIARLEYFESDSEPDRTVEIIRLLRSFLSPDNRGSVSAQVAAGEQLLSVSMHSPGRLTVGIDICIALAMQYEDGMSNPSISGLALAILANVIEAEHVDVDLEDMILFFCDPFMVPDTFHLREVLKIVICTAERYPIQEDNGTIDLNWLSDVIESVADMLTTVIMYSLDYNLAATAWCCAYTLLHCDDWGVTNRFAECWDAASCILNCLQVENYVNLASKDGTMTCTAFKWVLATVDILNFRSKISESVKNLWQLQDFDPTCCLIVCRLIDLTLDKHWGFAAVLHRSADEHITELSEEDTFMLSGVLGRVLRGIQLDIINRQTGEIECLSAIIVDFILNNLSVLVLKQLEVIEESFLRLDHMASESVLLFCNVLLSFACAKFVKVPKLSAQFAQAMTHVSSPLHSICFLLHSTNLYDILLLGDDNSIKVQITKFVNHILFALDIGSLQSEVKFYDNTTEIVEKIKIIIARMESRNGDFETVQRDSIVL